MKDIDLQAERAAFEAWFEPYWNGPQSDLAAWSGWKARAAVEADRAQRVPDGWVLIATDAYEAGFGKGEQAHKTGKDVENPWGDEPGREAWAMGYALGKERAASTPAPAQQEPTRWDDAKQAALNGWFLSLPDGRQAVLLQDKWMLAGAAFEAGRTLAAQHQEPPQQERKPMTHIKEQARSYQVAQLAPTTGMVAISSAAYIELYERHHGIKE